VRVEVVGEFCFGHLVWVPVLCSAWSCHADPTVRIVARLNLRNRANSGVRPGRPATHTGGRCRRGR
jgi:hypothetical protein